MNVHARGFAALSMAAIVAFSVAGVAHAAAKASPQGKQVLSTEREKISYMIGTDVGHSLQPVAQDLDMAAFERSIGNAFAGGQPLLDEAETKATGQALMQRLAARKGQNVPGVAPGTPAPPVAKDKVGLLVGADVGRSLVPIKSEIELPLFFQGLRTVFANGQSLLSEGEADTLRKSFSERIQAKMQVDAAQAAGKNGTAGTAFLTTNKTVKGVFTTPSGLQYMVLRQGAGARPKPSDRVRVNYRGTLLDGKVFDDSYARGQPTEFGLDQVIAGWTEGLSMMPIGAKYRFWVPAELAYGAKGMPGSPIGPNSTLIFDVELLGIL
ncbi:MAG: FKBP-type peptidyl-prolyl cis-trans isomerase [Luteimonas sp.]